MCIHWETLVGLLRTKNLVSSHPEDVEDLVGKLSDPSYLAKKTYGEHSKPKFMLSNKKHQQTRNLLDNFLLWTFQNVKKQSNYKPTLLQHFLQLMDLLLTLHNHRLLPLCFILSGQIYLKKNTDPAERIPPKKNTHVFQRKHENRSHIHVFGWVFQRSSLETNKSHQFISPAIPV